MVQMGDWEPRAQPLTPHSREQGSPCPGSRDASQEEQRPRRGSLRRVRYCTTATRICSLEG